MSRNIRLYPDSPNEKHLREIVGALERDAVIIYPTDTLYALGCSLKSIKGIAAVKQIKGKQSDDLSIICPDLSRIADYARVDNATFRLLRDNTPGAFTFILNASNRIPNKFLDNKRTVGIRVPANPIPLAITEMLGFPLVSTSVPPSRLDPEDMGDPELLWEEFRNKVDLFVDGGPAQLLPSTVVDCTSGEAVIVRQGQAELAG